MNPWRRSTASIAALLLTLATASCAALDPGLIGLVSSTPTPRAELHWSVVEIPKPGKVSEPTPSIAPPTEAALPPADAVTAAEVYPTPEPPTGPLITMEIVEDVVVPPDDDQIFEPVSASGKYVLVSIGEQHQYAYENGELIYSFVASTGMGNSTRVGTFQVLDKIPSAYGSTWNIWMPNWQRIKAIVGDEILIKASGGIRDLPGLVEMYRAGARRFGINLQSAASIMEQFKGRVPGEEIHL